MNSEDGEASDPILTLNATVESSTFLALAAAAGVAIGSFLALREEAVLN